jgi:hypothetical protein
MNKEQKQRKTVLRKIVSKILPVGPRSVLFGAHQFIIHPVCVYLAWRKLYSRHTLSTPLLLSFIVHDWGYLGQWCRNMDGPEGERHVEMGGKIMSRLYGPGWGNFTMRHSRFYCRQHNMTPSALCYADKLATSMMPEWLYLSLVSLSGELDEYLNLAYSDESKYKGEGYNDYDALEKKISTREEKINRWYSTMRDKLDDFAKNGAHQRSVIDELSRMSHKRYHK